MARTQGSGSVSPPVFKVLDFTQAAAVQNTWYTVFQGSNVAFDFLVVGITVADETISVKITIDDNVLQSIANRDLLFASNFCAIVDSLRLDNLLLMKFQLGAATASPTSSSATIGWLNGHSVKIEVKKTTAGGASALRVLGVYHRR